MHMRMARRVRGWAAAVLAAAAAGACLPAGAVILAVFVFAAIFSGVVFCIPPAWRGSPPAWLTVGSLCAVVFFGGFIVAQFSPVHLGNPTPPECRTL